MRIIVLIILTLALLSCKKEQDLQPSILYEAPYVIEDDPNNPVTHKRYELYKEFGVPIFFSDTIASVFITKNVHGDSIFEYEMLDLNWRFNGTSNIPYEYEYITDPEDQLAALAHIENYLNNTVKSLMPFSIFLVDEFSANGNSEIIEVVDENALTWELPSVRCINSFRTLLISQSHKDFSEDFFERLSLTLLKNQVKAAIKGDAYKAKLLNFQVISDPIWYDKYWFQIFDGTFSAQRWRTFSYTEEYSEVDAAHFARIREVFGQFGFIGHSDSWGFSSTPTSANDLNQYLNLILTYPREVFEKNWMNSPLVMSKYEILYDIIQNDMNVPLTEIIK